MWRDLYRSKLTSADDAVRIVGSGNRVHVHQGCSEPEELVAALMRRAPELTDVEIVHCATMGTADYTRPEFEGHFRHAAFFIGGNVREAVQCSRADYIPIFLSEIEALFESGAMPIDVSLLQCTPPDDYGYMSLGAGVDIALTAARYSKHVIVEVNDQCPRTFGDCFIHVRDVDAIVECSHPLPEYRSHEVTPVDEKIAAQIANLIPDGATIQTGIGAVPDCVLRKLRDHKDLGAHSEMCSDGFVELIESGALTGARKTLHPRKVITGFVLGTKRLFNFIHENPVFEFHPTSYVNDPFVISQNERMVAINSAIEIDLTGQVCADSLGPRPYSGIGGQVDFIRGAARSKGGVPLIALPSTAKNGSVSRITPLLKTAAGVVTSRGDVHYVVTEFGVANLHGKTIRQRAEALIQIAHPHFRSELERAAIELGHLSSRGIPAGR